MPEVTSSLPKLIVALDFENQKKAEFLVGDLTGLPITYKVGLELFVSEGPKIIQFLTKNKHPIFLDLKFHDIPNTVIQASSRAMDLGVEMFSVHLSNSALAFKGIFELAQKKNWKGHVLGISVLTSFSEQGWGELTRVLVPSLKTLKETSSVQASVLSLVQAGVSWGVRSIVCSAQEVLEVKKLYSDLYCVTPGIRLKEDDLQDQARVVTPKEAIQKGASAIVVGRSITGAKEPRKKAEAILVELGYKL